MADCAEGFDSHHWQNLHRQLCNKIYDLIENSTTVVFGGVHMPWEVFGLFGLSESPNKVPPA